METPRAVVMLSGGLDSAVCAALACWDYAEVYAFGVYYAQRHTIELQYAAALAKQLGLRWHKANVDASVWKQVPLVSPPEFVEKPDDGTDGLERGRSVYAMRDGGIPRSVVPGRNAVFLAHACALAEIIGGADVLFGANRDDAAGFVDCRPAFVAAYDALAHAGSGGRVGVRAPLLLCSKRNIAWLAQRVGLDPALTWSCYRPRNTVEGALPCGTCDACMLRADALAHPEPVL